MEYLQLKKSDAECFPEKIRAILCGPSASGKSQFIQNMICHKKKVFSQPYSKFVYCSPHLSTDGNEEDTISPGDAAFRQSLIDLAQPEEIVFYDHIITLTELNQESNYGAQRILIIIDDFSESVFSQDVTVKLFIKLSSHANTDIIVATHSGIKSSSGKHFSIVWNSANVIVIFRSLADRASIGFLSQRMFPHSENHLGKCLTMSTQLLGNYSHIIIFCNLDNDLNRTYEVRTNIFEDAYILFKNPNNYTAS